MLSAEEISRLLGAASEPKDKAMLSVAYGAGLRGMEVVALKVSDIDGKRMLTREVQTYRGNHKIAPYTAIADVAGVLRKHADNRQLDKVLASMPGGAQDYWRLA